MLMVPLSFGQFLFSNKIAVQTPEGKQFSPDHVSVLKTTSRITSVSQLLRVRNKIKETT